MCAFPGLTSPHLSPRLALIQPSPTSHRGTAIVECHDIGWGELVSSCTPVGSCWRAVLASGQRWEGCSRVPVSTLCRTPAWWLNTTAWASSWGILLGPSFILLIISMQAGRGSLRPSPYGPQCSWPCTVPPLRSAVSLARLWYPSVPKSSTAPRAAMHTYTQPSLQAGHAHTRTIR